MPSGRQDDPCGQCFADEVTSAFGFLIADYGYRCVEAGPTEVRYESRTAFIEVYREQYSAELDFAIGLWRGWLFRRERCRYNLYHIMELTSSVEPVCIQISTPDRVREFVPRLAQLVREHAQPLLGGDWDEFRRFAEADRSEMDRRHRERGLDDKRSKAEACWRARDFRRVVSVYGSMAADLTPLEAKRLSYAERHTGRGE